MRTGENKRQEAETNIDKENLKTIHWVRRVTNGFVGMAFCFRTRLSGSLLVACTFSGVLWSKKSRKTSWHLIYTLHVLFLTPQLFKPSCPWRRLCCLPLPFSLPLVHLQPFDVWSVTKVSASVQCSTLAQPRDWPVHPLNCRWNEF